MHDVFQYLKAKWSLWAFGLTAMALVPFMAYLGGQDVALGCYVSLILGFLLVLLLFVDGRSYVARLRQLRAICAHLEALPEALPEPQDALDIANQAVIRALAVQLAQTSRALEAAQREDLSYYTLWVHQIKTPIAAMRLVLQNGAAQEADVLCQELFKIERYAELALQYVKLGRSQTTL